MYMVYGLMINSGGPVADYSVMLYRTWVHLKKKTQQNKSLVPQGAAGSTGTAKATATNAKFAAATLAVELAAELFFYRNSCNWIFASVCTPMSYTRRT